MKTVWSIAIFMVILHSGYTYSKYGRKCEDIGCLNNEVCVMESDPCSYSTRRNDCGEYPTCKRVTNGQQTCETYVCPPSKVCKLDGGIPKCMDDYSKVGHVGYDTSQTNPDYKPSAPVNTGGGSLYPNIKPGGTTTRPQTYRSSNNSPGYNGGQAGSPYPPNSGQGNVYQPAGGYQQPGGGYQQQGGSYQQPGGGYQQQGGGYQQPGGGYQQQGSGYQQPGGGYRQSSGGYQQPGGGYQQQGGYQANGYGRQQQQGGYQQGGYQQPGYQQGSYQQGTYQLPAGYQGQGYQQKTTNTRFGAQNDASNPVLDTIKETAKKIGLILVCVHYLAQRMYGV